MLSAAAQSGKAGALCGTPARGRRCRSSRTACVTHCSKKETDNTLMQSGARAAAVAAAAALLLVQGQPAVAATKVKDPFKESQEQAAQFEKLIKERGGSLFKLKLPESAPVPKGEAVEEYVPPPQVELKAFPLQLAAPVRETTIEALPRVPAPEPPKKGSVAAEAVEGLVNITGGDLPAPPPAAERKPEAPKPFFSFPSPPKAEELSLPKPPSLPSIPSLPKPPSLPSLPSVPKPPSLPNLPTPPSLPSLPTPEPAAAVDTPTIPPPSPPPSPPQDTPKAFGGFFSGPEKAPESTGQAGKPELPQPEPAVTPGDANIVIPESKDVAPEPKVAAPTEAAPAPAPPAPFSFFGGGSKPQDKAPAPKAEEKPAAPFSFFGASKAGEKTAEDAQSPSLPLPSPVPTPEEVKPKPDDNPFAGLFNSSPAAEPKGPPAPDRTAAQTAPAKEEKPASPFSFFGASKAGEKTAEEGAQSPSLPLPSPVPTPEEVKPKPDDNPFAGLFNSSLSAEPTGSPAPVRTTEVATPGKEEAPAAPFSFFGTSKAGEKTAEEAQSPSLPLPSLVPTPEEVKPKPDDNPFAGLFNSSPSAEPKGPPAPVRTTTQAPPAKEEKADDNPFAGLFATPPAAKPKGPPAPVRTAQAGSERAAPAAEGGGDVPVVAFFGGIIVLAIAAFTANARNAAGFKAAEEARKASEAKALQVEDASKASVRKE